MLTSFKYLSGPLAVLQESYRSTIYGPYGDWLLRPLCGQARWTGKPDTGEVISTEYWGNRKKKTEKGAAMFALVGCKQT